MDYWAGFVNGRLHFSTIDDLFGGCNQRLSPSIFKNRKEARKQFKDVRKIRIVEVAQNDTR